MRIVYCLDSINYVGGIQKVTVTKANALAAVPGNEVWVIVADDSGKRMTPLSRDVHFVDLGINYYKDDWKSRWNVLKGIFIKRRLHRKRLKEQFRLIHPDVVISVGQSEKNFLPQIRGEWVTVREYRYTRNYRRLLADDFFSKAEAMFGDLLEKALSLPKYDRIVVQTYEEKQTRWNNSKRVSVIYNPLNTRPLRCSSLTDRKVVAIGRLTKQKNFPSLIRSYAVVANRFPDWNLDIYGDGSEKQFLTRLVSDLSMNDSIHLCGSTSDAFEALLQASVFVLSSRFEGMPNAMLEAISCGIPVVSYSCPCGPKDIITDGVNGFLVPEGDEQMMAERICWLIEHEEERKRMGRAAFERSKDFSIERIVQMWMSLFEELIIDKKK